MAFDWTNPATWTLKQAERAVFANAVIAYCDNAASKYPDASHSLAHLRSRATALADMVRGNLVRSDLDCFHAQLSTERDSEGTGFALLVDYVSALRHSV